MRFATFGTRRAFLTAITGAALAVGSACVEDPTLIPADVEDVTFASSLGVNLAASTRTTNGAYIRDITVGTGAVVAAGQMLTVKYTGWLVSGSQFDSNQAQGYTFKLGNHEVIKGWDEGIPGMRVGGKRQIIVPPALAYGFTGNGPIPGNAVLVFVVEVVSAQ